MSHEQDLRAARERIEQAINTALYALTSPVSIDEALDKYTEELLRAETAERHRESVLMTEIVFQLVRDHPAAQEDADRARWPADLIRAMRGLTAGRFVSWEDLVVQLRKKYGPKPN